MIDWSKVRIGVDCRVCGKSVDDDLIPISLQANSYAYVAKQKVAADICWGCVENCLKWFHRKARWCHVRIYKKRPRRAAGYFGMRDWVIQDEIDAGTVYVGRPIAPGSRYFEASLNPRYGRRGIVDLTTLDIAEWVKALLAREVARAPQ